MLLAAWQIHGFHRPDVSPKPVAECLTGRRRHLHHSFVVPDDVDDRRTTTDEVSPEPTPIQLVPMLGQHNGVDEPEKAIRFCAMQHKLWPLPRVEHPDRQSLHFCAQYPSLLLACVPPEQLSAAIADSQLFPRIHVALDIIHIRIDHLPHKTAKHMPKIPKEKLCSQSMAIVSIDTPLSLQKRGFRRLVILSAARHHHTTSLGALSTDKSWMLGNAAVGSIRSPLWMPSSSTSSLSARPRLPLDPRLSNNNRGLSFLTCVFVTTVRLSHNRQASK